MALTIETGVGVVGANSYITYAEARSFALARGITLPSADSKLEILIVKAKDYLESIRDRYKGSKAYGQSYLQWPRNYVDVDGFDITSTVIPEELKNAQCQMVLEIFAGADPLESSGGLQVKVERIDVIEAEYFAPKEASSYKTFPKVDAFLTPLFKNGGSLLNVIRA